MMRWGKMYYTHRGMMNAGAQKTSVEV